MACRDCGLPLRDHDRRKVFPEDGPTGSYHYSYYNCPGGFSPNLLRGLAGAGA